jgi:anti-sigma factor RsiW
MKNCQDIQPELSACIDGELTPPQRAEVEAHVASCPRCQRELAELKALAAGMAALPKLQPPPRFLAEVRRKIARGHEPELVSWLDYLFRPFWLKVPLEAVALVVIGMFAVWFVKPRPAEQVATVKMARAEKTNNKRSDVLRPQSLVAQEKASKEEPVNTPVPLPTVPAPSAAVASVIAIPNGSPAGPIQALHTRAAPEQKVEQTLLAPETAGGEKAPLDSLAQNRFMPGVDGNQPAGESPRRIPAATNSVPGLTVATAPTSDVADWARSLGIDQSKLHDIVTVDARDPGDIRNRAGQLAAKCNGRIIPAPESKAATGQVFFVELPWECADGFKSDLLRNSGTKAIADKAGSRDESAVTMGNPVGSRTGELTGTVETNAEDKLLARLRLTVEVKPPASTTTVLEIRVVPPAN